jgi:hypothetical protein
MKNLLSKLLRRDSRLPSSLLRTLTRAGADAPLLRRRVSACQDPRSGRSLTRYGTTNDEFDIATANADIVQLAIRELGQLTHRIAIFAPSGQLLRNRLESGHDLLLFRQALRLLQCGMFCCSATYPRPTGRGSLLKLVRLLSWFRCPHTLVLPRENSKQLAVLLGTGD